MEAGLGYVHSPLMASVLELDMARLQMSRTGALRDWLCWFPASFRPAKVLACLPVPSSVASPNCLCPGLTWNRSSFSVQKQQAPGYGVWPRTGVGSIAAYVAS